MGIGSDHPDIDADRAWPIVGAAGDSA